MKPLVVSLDFLEFPRAHTCDGENISPWIGIDGVNTGTTKSLAIIMNDPDLPGGGGFVHWIAWNIELVKMIPEKYPKSPKYHFHSN